MKTKKNTQRSRKPDPSQPRLSKAKLDALVEEATVDAYNESEQATGFYTMIEDNLKLPFETEILGVAVTITGIDITEDERIVAICKRGNQSQKIPIFDLPLPSPRPTGSEWIDVLIETFEERRYPLKKATPIESLIELMAANNLKQKDLVDVFGAPSITSEVLNGKRNLTTEHIRRLSARFHVTPELFI